MSPLNHRAAKHRSEEAAIHVANIKHQIARDIEAAVHQIILEFGGDALANAPGDAMSKLRRLIALHPDKGLAERVFDRMARRRHTHD